MPDPRHVTAQVPPFAGASLVTGDRRPRHAVARAALE
jgi:hypothetical protein